MRHDSLGEWLTWLEGLHPAAIDLGLERIATVAGRMGLGRLPCPVVSVAGTNGKGSCVAMLEALLGAAGHRVAAYTSPHLVRYNERVRIGGHEVGDAALCTAFARVDAARGDISLTYFEFGTLAALDLFARERPDIAILEVGLGGRLDAVNIVDSDVALITSIALDHVEWLGNDREAIAREKAGILRTGRPAVCADPDPPLSLIEAAATVGAPLYLAGRDYGARLASEAGGEVGGEWTWWGGSVRLEGLPAPGLSGRFQYDNAAAVLMVLRLLPAGFEVSDSLLRATLPALRVAGRFQCLAGPVPVILDVAHNADAAAALAANLAAAPVPGRTRMVAAMLGDKDIDGMVSSVSGIADEWHVTTLPVARAAPARRLQDAITRHAPGVPVHVYEDAASAWRAVREVAQPGDRIVVFGSFYTVGAVIECEKRP